MTTVMRIDPPTCGCTDCLTGWSKPISIATDEELTRLCRGWLQNASGIDLDVMQARMQEAANQARRDMIRERTHG